MLRASRLVEGKKSPKPGGCAGSSRKRKTSHRRMGLKCMYRPTGTMFGSSPWGGELLVRDIDGTIVRLVARPDRLDVVDAPDNGHQVFDDLEAARVARLRKKS